MSGILSSIFFALCIVILHSLVCKLLQDVNPKLQESKSKLRMYDESALIPYDVIDIKGEVNPAKTKSLFQAVDTKKRSSNISISKSSTKFSHPECKQ